MATGINPNKLPAAERWQWFAYNYGWRRVMLSRDDNLPIDSERKYFAPDLVLVAEAFYQRLYHQPNGWVPE
jgi:hypothetical protein